VEFNSISVKRTGVCEGDKVEVGIEVLRYNPFSSPLGELFFVAVLSAGVLLATGVVDNESTFLVFDGIINRDGSLGKRPRSDKERIEVSKNMTSAPALTTISDVMVTALNTPSSLQVILTTRLLYWISINK
jgi:hypothetical protein